MNKRIFALLIALMLALLPTLAVAEADADGGYTAAEVRYAFEHNMLPRYFYADPQNLIDRVAELGLYVLWASVATENGADPTYPEEDYVIHMYDLEDGGTLMQIELPDPDANLLCYRIYFLYNPETGEAGYYTAESDTFSPGTCFLCGWDQEGKHLNFGGTDAISRSDANYAEKLAAEAEMIQAIAKDGKLAASTSAD